MKPVTKLGDLLTTAPIVQAFLRNDLTREEALKRLIDQGTDEKLAEFLLTRDN